MSTESATIQQHDNPGHPVSSFSDGINCWSILYSSVHGNQRFEAQVEEGEQVEAVMHRLEGQAVALYRRLEKEDEAQRHNQALAHQLISVLEQGAFDACSSEQKAHVRQLIATKKVEKTHE